MLFISVLLLTAPVSQNHLVFGLSLMLPEVGVNASSQALPQFAGSLPPYVTVVFLGTPVSNKMPELPPPPAIVSNQSVIGTGLALARRSPSISNPPGSPFGAVPAPTTSVNCVQAVTVPW